MFTLIISIPRTARATLAVKKNFENRLKIDRVRANKPKNQLPPTTLWNEKYEKYMFDNRLKYIIFISLFDSVFRADFRHSFVTSLGQKLPFHTLFLNKVELDFLLSF